MDVVTQVQLIYLKVTIITLRYMSCTCVTSENSKI